MKESLAPAVVQFLIHLGEVGAILGAPRVYVENDKSALIHAGGHNPTFI